MTKNFTKRARSGIAAVITAAFLLPLAAFAGGDDDDSILGGQTVAAQLGGLDGITQFLGFAAGAIVTDAELAPFFGGARFSPLTESATQIVACLARLVDHDLGGSSPKNGVIIHDADSPDPDHKCRSSMSNVHKTMNISDHNFDRFVAITATKAVEWGTMANTPDGFRDQRALNAVVKMLNRYRGSISHK